MKALMRSFTTIVPVSSPQQAPVSMAIRKATGSGRFSFTIASIHNAAETAPTEPMDRSISPSTST